MGYSQPNNCLSYLLVYDFLQLHMALGPKKRRGISSFQYNDSVGNVLSGSYDYRYCNKSNNYYIAYIMLAFQVTNNCTISTLECLFSKLYPTSTWMALLGYYNILFLEDVWSTCNTCSIAKSTFYCRSYHTRRSLRRKAGI